jgi:selenocysteine lyase/cysteine desulfurase
MSLDVEEIRRDTPSCDRLVHFDNAGCSLMPDPVHSVIAEFQDQEQSIGGYRIGLERKSELDGFYSSAANLVNCSPDEIAYCESGTRGWQQFFYSLKFEPGDRIITTRVDYGSNFVAYIQAASKWGVEVSLIDTDEIGDLDLDHLESLVNPKTRLISVSHIPTGNGIINDAVAIGAIANNSGVPYLLDACQSVGQLDVDVNQIGCTALSISSRKYIRGPRGTGFLYVSRDYFQNVEPMFIEMQGVSLNDQSSYELVDSARRFENFEFSLAAKLGAGVAMQYAHDLGMGEVEDRVIKLAEICRRKLESVPGVTIQDRGRNQCGIVTFTIDGTEPVQIRAQLWQENINTWVSTGPGSLVDFQSRGIDAVSRASLHYFNTEDEIVTFCESVENIVRHC